jgi:hypothetical protein
MRRSAKAFADAYHQLLLGHSGRAVALFHAARAMARR